MSDTTKSVDELRLLVSKLMLGTMGIKNKYNSPAVHPKPMNDELDVLFLETVTAITQLFTKQLQEAEIRAYRSVMSVAETEEGRRHAYDFCAMRLATLTQDVKGVTDDTPRV